MRGMDQIAYDPPTAPPPAAQGPQLVLQAGHTGSVTMAMFAPGWSQVAYQNGDHRMLLSRPMRPVSHLDVLVTQADGVVIIWDRRTGQELRRTPKGSIITSLAISANGAWLLGSDKAEVGHLWSVATGAEIKIFQKVGFGIALSPDGSLAVLGSDDPSSRGVYETATGRQVFTFDIDDFSELEFAPSGDRVLTYSFGGQVSLWDVPHRRLLFRRYQPALNRALLDAAGRVVTMGHQIRKNEKGENEAFGTRLQVLDPNGHTAFEVLRDDSILQMRLTGDPDTVAANSAKLRRFGASPSPRSCLALRSKKRKIRRASSTSTISRMWSWRLAARPPYPSIGPGRSECGTCGRQRS